MHSLLHRSDVVRSQLALLNTGYAIELEGEKLVGVRGFEPPAPTSRTLVGRRLLLRSDV